jgi:hypothetical protein
MNSKKLINKYKEGYIDIFSLVFEFDKLRNESNRKDDGIVYTPKNIVSYIIKNINYDINETILEPSVGHGMFLFCLIEYVEKKYLLKPQELAKWFEKNVNAMDISKDNIEDLKNIINIYFEKKGIYNISTTKIIAHDTLFYDFNTTFDCIIGNPPYIRTKNINESYLKEVRKKYKTCESGNIDLYYAFVELANSIAKKSSFIVPNSYISNKSAQKLRTLILDNVDYIIDFKKEQIFEEAKTYTSIFKITNKNKNKNILYSNGIDNKFIEKDKKELNNEQWIFESLKKQYGKSIEEFSKVKSGIATLRDKLYIVEDTTEISLNNIIYYKKTFEDESFFVEKESTKDFYKITKAQNKLKIIFPYDNELNIIDENSIINKYPELYKYLVFCKEELNRRDKGKVHKYENWFAYGRKQGLHLNEKKYHLLIPLMMTKGTKCTIIKTNNIFLFTSGFVINSNDLNELKNIKKTIENKDFFDFISVYGKPWAGKKPYFSFSSSILKKYKF